MKPEKETPDFRGAADAGSLRPSSTDTTVTVHPFQPGNLWSGSVESRLLLAPPHSAFHRAGLTYIALFGAGPGGGGRRSVL